MNSRNRRIYSLLAASALLAGCVAGERHETTVERQWPAGAIHRIEVREVDGAITVDSAAADRVTLVAHVRSRGIAPRPNRENQGFFRTAIAGDTLTIGREDEHRIRFISPFWSSADVTVDYELRVPASVALELRTVNGRIAVNGIDGEASATTVNGPITVAASGNNELYAKTVNGRVEAHFTSAFQGARLKTVNGAVRAVLPTSASFNGDFSQVNGDFEAGFPLSIHSNPGARRVSGEVNGGKYELKIETVNGDITVDNATPHVPAPPAAPSSTAPAVPSVPAAPAAPAAPPSLTR